MQNVAVIQELTVYENIDYFCGLYIPDKKTRKQYVTEAIQFVGLEDFVKFYPKKLSGGLLRRLNIACGIAHKPKLIILDEPTVAVDPQSRNRILEGIQELNRNSATIIYVALHGGSGADLYPYCHSGSWTKNCRGHQGRTETYDQEYRNHYHGGTGLAGAVA